ncbi:MAG TPA: DUF3617 family protein [Burkholderiales bacterium]
MHVRIAASVLGLLLPFFAVAADDGELWEVTTQMNIPGMPAGMAGMGGGAQRVCAGKDPKEDATRRPDMQKCKVVDLKQTATRMTLTMSCPDGQAVIDQTYNAARTEYKGTMTMKSKDGDMVINTAGRKVGTCDVQQARQQREEKGAKMKAQSEAQVAAMNQQQAAQRAKTTEAVAAACSTAASGMDASKFPDCLRPGSPMAKSATCTDPRLTEYTFPAAARASCDTKKAEYCQKFQTEAGFVQAVAADRRTQLDGAEVCGLKRASVQSKLCQGAVQRESLDFLAGQCPGEAAKSGASLCPAALKKEAYSYVARYCKSDAQALFKKNCAGREYTALPDRKVARMCTSLASVSDDGSGRPAAASTPAAKAAEAKKGTTGQQVEQTFGKGLDKIKGLFGR